MNNIADKSIGSLIGGAIGDALGYPVEFIGSMESIVSRYGEGGIRTYELAYPGFGNDLEVALISDDTQMTLYTAEGLLEAAKSHRDVIEAIKEAYLEWFSHQEGEEISIEYHSKLGEIEELNKLRAPGITCLTAMHSHNIGIQPNNDSKGCGGIMRVAPIAIYGATHGWSFEETGRMAGEVAEITHLHPMSTLASATQAMIIYQCLKCEDTIEGEAFKTIVEVALSRVSDIFPKYNDYLDGFQRIIQKSLVSSTKNLPDWKVIECMLGGGWVAEETLAIAIFSVLRHIDDFRACMICAVNHGGDSDSTGAVAGNILGAILGVSGIPDDLVKPLQFHEIIRGMASQLTL